MSNSLACFHEDEKGVKRYQKLLNSDKLLGAAFEEVDDALLESKQGVIAAGADTVACHDFTALLADDDLACLDNLASIFLDSEAFAGTSRVLASSAT